MSATAPEPTGTLIHTPDRRLRVFVSSTLDELADERAAVRDAVTGLGLAAVLVDAGARAHAAGDLFRAYLEQSDVFVGVYWQDYGDVADEFDHAAHLPRLLYEKVPAPDRDARLTVLLDRMQTDEQLSVQPFRTPGELSELVENDLAVLLTQRFEAAEGRAHLPAADAAPGLGGLPSPPTPLVGREREVEDVAGLLARDDVRLVTLTGPGGIGKSRVAVAAAELAAGRFPDGVRFVALSAVRDPVLVLPTVAKAVGVREHPDRPLLDLLAADLGSRRALLVLDGFEQVLAAGPALASLLLECPGVTALVTSRAVLNLRAEFDYPIPPLPVPQVGRESDEPAAAVRLFAALAAAANPQFALTRDTLPDVAQICRRLDGLPLAIELAAARVRLLPPRALLARLSSRLDVLTGGPRDLPERQQTLRAALAWDYDLLDGEERALFRRLAVCSGGFGLDLADALATSSGGLQLDVLDGLDSLVGKSLLQHRDDPDGAPYFAMLDTIREYALDRLHNSGEFDAAHRAFAEWLVGFAEAAVLTGREQVRWLGQLEREHANFRAALQWAGTSGEVELELRLAAALAPFWVVHSHLVEGARFLGDALAHSTGVAVPARLKVLGNAAKLARSRGDYDGARRMLEEGRALAESLHDRRGLAHTHHDLGAVFVEQGELAAGRDHCARGLALYTELGDERGRANSLNGLGVIAELEGDREAATRYYLDSLDVYLRLEDRFGVARGLMNVGSCIVDLGLAPVGRSMLLRSLAHWDLLGNKWDVADELEFLAFTVAATGEPAAAVQVLGAAEAVRRAIGALRAPYLRADYERRVDTMRAALGEQAFAVAWERGLTAPYDDGLAFAFSLGDASVCRDVDDFTVDRGLLQPVRERFAAR